MPHDLARHMLQGIASALDLPPGAHSRVTFEGNDRLPSCFPVSELAAASIAAAALAISELIGVSASAPPVTVALRSASLWFGWSLRPLGWDMPNPWDPIAGDYAAADGWIKLHTNVPHHRTAALSVLGCEPMRESVASIVATWSSEALEEAIVAAGGCAARLRSSEEWAVHPQGQAVAAEPLVLWDSPAACTGDNWRPCAERPLAGLRVLDLTRVLAGPVATRFLAGFGADVLRIDPPGWDEPGVIPEVTLGKRCARLDLKTAAGMETLIALLSQADVLVHGYRADALERLGIGTEVRRAICPHLVDISLDAYGHSGPWATRRGFDSLVQFSSGIAATGMEWRKAIQPVSLPVQALDHATGYLLAAAAARGLKSQVSGAGPMRARFSLARTAKLLTDHRAGQSDGLFAGASDADFDTTEECTDWGPGYRLLPPVSIEGAHMHWPRAAAKLGSCTPSWEW